MSVFPGCDVIMSLRAASLKNESVRAAVGRSGDTTMQQLPWPSPTAPERFFPQRHLSPDALPAREREVTV